MARVTWQKTDLALHWGPSTEFSYFCWSPAIWDFTGFGGSYYSFPKVRSFCGRQAGWQQSQLWEGPGCTCAYSATVGKQYPALGRASQLPCFPKKISWFCQKYWFLPRTSLGKGKACTIQSTQWWVAVLKHRKNWPASGASEHWPLILLSQSCAEPCISCSLLLGPYELFQ